jgi:fatty acyl-CoA reductase
MNSNISEFYRDRSVLITGASGFVGKVLLEKLLRDCPLIKNIYLLLRPKGGQNSRQRLNELLSSVVFDRIRDENASVLNKVIAISGDVTYAELGINPNDRDILVNNVSIIFHSAATVRFDEPLK